MSETLDGLRRRWAKVERDLGKIQKWKKRKPGACNCAGSTAADPTKPEKFEAEMNLECPIHEFRDLGLVSKIEQIGGRANPFFSMLNVSRLDELLAEYRARQLAAKKKVLEVLEDDPEDWQSPLQGRDQGWQALPGCPDSGRPLLFSRQP